LLLLLLLLLLLPLLLRFPLLPLLLFPLVVRARKEGKLSRILVWESNPVAGDPRTYTLKPERDAKRAAVKPAGPAPATITS